MLMPGCRVCACVRGVSMMGRWFLPAKGREMPEEVGREGFLLVNILPVRCLIKGGVGHRCGGWG